MPSLRERFERARRPGAPQADVDILLAGLAPGAPHELSPRELADLLQQIIQDPRLGSRRDRGGWLARHVAAEALQALGPPYAQELPASAIPRPQLSPVVDRRILLGLSLLAAVAVLEWLAFIGAAVLPTPDVCGLGSEPPPPRTLRSEWQNIVVPGLMCLIPTLFALGTWMTRRGALLQMATVVLWLCGAGKLLLFFVNWLSPLMFSLALTVFLLTGALTALAGFCFRPVWEAYRRKFPRAT
jgi:hypothetical protein